MLDVYDVEDARDPAFRDPDGDAGSRRRSRCACPVGDGARMKRAGDLARSQHHEIARRSPR
jgi:hypothetical protein